MSCRSCRWCWPRSATSRSTRGGTLVLTANATDTDPGKVLTYSLGAGRPHRGHDRSGDRPSFRYPAADGPANAPGDGSWSAMARRRPLVRRAVVSRSTCATSPRSLPPGATSRWSRGARCRAPARSPNPGADTWTGDGRLRRRWRAASAGTQTRPGASRLAHRLRRRRHLPRDRRGSPTTTGGTGHGPFHRDRPGRAAAGPRTTTARADRRPVDRRGPGSQLRPRMRSPSDPARSALLRPSNRAHPPAPRSNPDHRGLLLDADRGPGGPGPIVVTVRAGDDSNPNR